MTSDRLARALEFAFNIHKGQFDKAGRPYMLHVCRVVDALAKEDYDYQVVGALHDTVEDSDSPVATRHAIESYFGRTVAEAVDSVTRRDRETYAQFIDRARAHPIGRRVKFADVVDRLRDTRVLTRGMIERYQDARAALMPGRAPFMEVEFIKESYSDELIG